jgi:hypothetical protein
MFRLFCHTQGYLLLLRNIKCFTVRKNIYVKFGVFTDVLNEGL